MQRQISHPLRECPLASKSARGRCRRIDVQLVLAGGRGKAFTLIEQLVVIAVIAVLMDVLMRYTPPIQTTRFSRFWQFIPGNAILCQFLAVVKGYR
ncbi:MAG: prepilin-type N-terminal cleavage/methylation domain-containing protein [Planctomycetota bacterium]